MLKANMASPVIEGTMSARPYISQYVDVVHEDLQITIDEHFEKAHYNIKYHIDATKAGYQIPFLFYASEYMDGFTIKIDGKAVEPKEIPYEFKRKNEDGSKFKDFSYFFEKDSSSQTKNVIMSEDSGGVFVVNIHDMVYFECDISRGRHLIEVSYMARPWLDKSTWVTEYSFRYALSPARYWKSFGTLDVIVNTSTFGKTLRTNLGKPAKGKLDNIAQWSFDRLPTDVMQITYIPKVNRLAEFLIWIGPNNLAYFTGAVLTAVHWVSVWRYRKRWLQKKYSPVVSWGSVLVPMLFLICWVWYYSLIDFSIGKHASKRHGYIFLTYFLYPVILPFYWLVFWQIDRALKRQGNSPTLTTFEGSA